jgi:hypothetical protein
MQRELGHSPRKKIPENDDRYISAEYKYELLFGGHIDTNTIGYGQPGTKAINYSYLGLLQVKKNKVETGYRLPH